MLVISEFVMAGGVDLGRMVRDQQRAADRRGRRGLSTGASESLRRVPGVAACTSCGDEYRLAEMLMTEHGVLCDVCEVETHDDAPSLRFEWLSDLLMAFCTIGLTVAICALPWMIADPQPYYSYEPTPIGTVIASMMGGLGIVIGPILGPLALFKGLAALRQLRNMADAVAPRRLPGHGVLRVLHGGVSLGGLGLTLVSFGIWFVVLGMALGILPVL